MDSTVEKQGISSLQRFGEFLEKKLNSVVTIEAYFATAVLAVMMFLGTADVAGRYFNHPIYGAYELIAFLLVCLAASSFAFAELKKKHIRIMIITDHLPKKVQEILDIIVHFIGFGLFVVMTWRMAALAQRYIAMGPKGLSEELDIPIYPFMIILSLGFLLLAMMFLVDLIHSISKAVKE